MAPCTKCYEPDQGLPRLLASRFANFVPVSYLICLCQAGIDICGNDSYGIPALHKFASWNKTVYLDLLIPKLTPEQLNATSTDGKTALHWAVEMAAVNHWFL